MTEHHADILIHVDETLEDGAIQGLEQELGTLDGVYSVCVHQRTPHLLVVEYDPLRADSGHFLRQVSAHGIHAELVGL
jgi:hypothetical protein